MRRLSASLALLLCTVLGSFTPAAVAPTRAASTAPKVVIVVGATHGATESYRQDADLAYAEAIRYTPNVVKVYSPQATWSVVKAAAQGASILIYFGHGNGWPSPYAYDAAYATKDGFGLNYDLNGDGTLTDYEIKYYGEPSVASLDLAPNAIVLLGHLCYASGNSEPGGAEPSLTVARQRVDNYAAGFLRSNAAAVIADGHQGPVSYIRSLFTTHQSIEQLWRSQPNFHGNESSFASSRTGGATAYMDPETATGGYYRSLVTEPGLTTDEIVDTSPTDADPLLLTVPGKASVASTGAGVYPDSALTPAPGTGLADVTLASGDRLAVLASATRTDGSIAVQVKGLDDPSLEGWMAATDLIARDSTAPAIWSVDTGTGYVSPNGDGRSETIELAARFSESVTWQLRIKAADGTVLKDLSGTGSRAAMTWDALVTGAPVADGTYGWSVRAVDGWKNGPTSRTGTITVDTVGPTLAGVAADVTPLPWISPNADLSRDSTRWAGTLDQAGSLLTRIQDAGGTVVRSITTTAPAGPVSVAWDGRTDAGAAVPDGTYSVRIVPRDMAGNNGSSVTRSVVVDGRLGQVNVSRTLLYPQDGDRLAKNTTLGFTLRTAATVRWTIVNSKGAVVATLLDGVATPAGTISRLFDARRPDGTFLPTGSFRSVVTLVPAEPSAAGAPVISQSAAFSMMAFAVSLSDTTPRRGQSITVYATSAESLSTRPRVYIYQPGKATWGVTMTMVSKGRYRVTLRLKTGGGTGIVKFRVSAADADGRKQSTTKSVVLH